MAGATSRAVLPAGVEAVLWDLDATLIDTEALLDEAIRAALVKVSPQAAKAQPELVNTALRISRGCHDKGPGSWPEKVIAAMSLTDCTCDQLHDAAYEVFDARLPSVSFMAGAEAAVATVAALQVPALPGGEVPGARAQAQAQAEAGSSTTPTRTGRMPMAIVTSGTRASTDLKTGFYPSLFKDMAAVITVNDVAPHAKPHHLPYALAAACLGCDISRCVVVEDSVPGCTAGARAGAFVVAVPLPHHRETIAGIIGSRGVVVSSLEEVDWAAILPAPPSKPRLDTLPVPLPASSLQYLKTSGRAALLAAIEGAGSGGSSGAEVEAVEAAAAAAAAAVNASGSSLSA